MIVAGRRDRGGSSSARLAPRPRDPRLNCRRPWPVIPKPATSRSRSTQIRFKGRSA